MKKYYSALDVFLILLVASVYFVSAKFGLLFAFVHESATALWPPTGIAIAVTILFGYKFLPGIFLGAFAANIVTAGNLYTSLGIATGNMLESLVVTFLVRRARVSDNLFVNLKSVAVYLCAIGFGTAVSATFGVTSLFLGGFAEFAKYFAIWFTWWLGDIGGALIVAPPIILWRLRKGDSEASFKERVVTSVCVGAAAVTLFTGALNGWVRGYSLEYLIIPFIVLSSIRLGKWYSAFSTFVVAILASYGAVLGVGPFARPDPNESLLLLQMFLGVVSLMALALSATSTELSRLSKEIKKSALLFGKMSDMVTLTDKRGIVTYASPSTKNIIGYSPEEVVGRWGLEFAHPDDRPELLAKFSDFVLRDGESEVATLRIKKKGDDWIWVEGSSTNLLNEPGVKAIVSSYRDITDRKRVEQEIKDRNLELKKNLIQDEALLNSMGEGVIATDQFGVIISINKAALRFLGWSKEDLTGNKLDDVVRVEDAEGRSIPVSERPIGMVLKRGESYVINKDFYYIRQDGARFPVAMVVTPLTIDGEIYGAIEVFRDITKEKEAERAQNEFISIASHQLRTPIATIHWYSEMISDEKVGELNQKQKEYIANIFNANERLSKLTSELLNASRVAERRFHFKLEDVNIREVTEASLKDVESVVREKSIRVEKEYGEGIDSVVIDMNVVRIVLQNLISNAVKYTVKEGNINVGVKRDKDFLHIFVSDTGYGIPENQQGKIFTKFFRADNVKDKEPDGTGLGLYIVKSILDRIGGNITFESEENKGSKFHVSIPLDPSHF